MKQLLLPRLALATTLAGVCLLFAAPAQAETAPATGVTAQATELLASPTDRVKPQKEKIIKPKRRKHKRQQRTNHGPRKPIFPQADRKSGLHLWFVGL